ncbi:MAG TPA: alkaline phosphatase [Gammaproteobacteria bacterium]|nr:alkaline phosphatase [Gammaproteobacteria bacterium]
MDHGHATSLGYRNIYLLVFSLFLFLFISQQTFAKPAAKTTVKNVILLIGDGMGPQQYALAMSYAQLAPDAPIRKLNLEKLMSQGEVGLMMTYPKGALVVDSAASATQLATGHYAGSEMIGLDYKGNPQATILELARDAGKSTGLVSDTRITHATPAAFAAHQPHRSMEDKIATDLINNNVDVMLSAGLQSFLPQGVRDKKSNVYANLRQQIPAHIKLVSKRKDDRNLLNEAENKGYHLVFDRESMFMAPESRKLLGLFDSARMPDGIRESQTENEKSRKHPTLLEMTSKALDRLSQNEKGFFLMIEAGQIDWAAHSSDVGTMLHQMLQFDKTIGYTMAWARKNGDTLLVLTADHETGSFGFSYSSFETPKAKNLEGKAFTGIKYKPKYNFGTPKIIDMIYQQKKSYTEMVSEFDALPERQQTAASLMNIVNKNSEFKISLSEAEEILKPVDGGFYVNDFKAFYVYDNRYRQNRLGITLSRHQNVVWGTGTHTATPVPVVAFGPEAITGQFNGIHHSTAVAMMMRKALGLTISSPH